MWHLVRHDNDNPKDSDRSNKLVTEIYLTRYGTSDIILTCAMTAMKYPGLI